MDVLTREETFDVIRNWQRTGVKKPKIVVTAYSEFFVNALRDKEFGRIIKKADLVTPDGKSVLAAVAFDKKIQKLKNSKNQNIVNTFGEGLRVGGKILNGTVGESVTGVWLFEKITKNAGKHNWRIFLLGGWDNLSGEVATMLRNRFPGIRVESHDGENVVGEDPATDKMVVEKINKFKPDFLFVQYRPIVQEKWIESHISNLKVGVAMGVGGTFDEYAGRLKNSPEWMERHGLKWLWRLLIQPRRWGRMIDAVIVFPWLVFRESLRR